MRLWLLHRADNDSGGYDTYDSMVVAAETEEEARLIHPSGTPHIWTGQSWRVKDWSDDSWTAPGKLMVREVGTANDGVTGVICASFNAG